jgi:hypothetical protein
MIIYNSKELFEGFARTLNPVLEEIPNEALRINDLFLQVK